MDVKTVKGFSDYTINRHGEVVNAVTNHALKQYMCKKGYLHHSNMMSDSGKRYKKPIHRLVAIAFIPNPFNLPEVNHIDEDKSNNFVDNLEWCTRQYNAEYTLSKTFSMVSPSGDVTTIHNMAKFCRNNNLNRGNLHKVFKGVRKSHGGWTAYNPR